MFKGGLRELLNLIVNQIELTRSMAHDLADVLTEVADLNIIVVQNRSRIAAFVDVLLGEVEKVVRDALFGVYAAVELGPVPGNLIFDPVNLLKVLLELVFLGEVRLHGGLVEIFELVVAGMMVLGVVSAGVIVAGIVQFLSLELKEVVIDPPRLGRSVLKSKIGRFVVRPLQISQIRLDGEATQLKLNDRVVSIKGIRRQKRAIFQAIH